MQPVMELARLTRVWTSVVGEPWATVGKPLRIHNGILFLGVPDASWAQRLALDGRKLKRAVEKALGHEVTIRHRVIGAADAEPWTPVEPRFDDPHVAEAVEKVPQGPLRDALRAYLAHLAAFQERNGITTNNPEEK